MMRRVHARTECLVECTYVRWR